jgi:hypothetical protein
MANPKGNTLAAEALEALRTLHKDHQNTDARLQQVEKAGKIFREKQSKMVEKLDGIYELLQQWNISSGRGSAQKSPGVQPTQPAPQHQQQPKLTTDGLAFFKRTFTEPYTTMRKE